MDGFDVASDDIKRLAGDGPIEWGQFLWCERRYVRAGLPPMPAWWANHYRAFAASGASEFVAAKGTRGGGSTNWVGWEIAQAIFTPKVAHESVELILPVMAATVAQANGRSLNFQQRLVALGYEQIQRRVTAGARRTREGWEDDGAKVRVGDRQFWASLPSANGINTVEFRDVHGRLLTVRTACASASSASEYTAFDFFGDEVAQWGDVARTVLTLGRTRLKNQRPGRSYLISQPLPGTEFEAIARAGSNKHRYVCTLAENGVEADRRARAWLRRECEAESRRGGALASFYGRLLDDPRLRQDLDTKSPWCPAWAILPAGNPEYAAKLGLDASSPEAAMAECCRLALMDVGREDGLDPLEQLWWGFGGHPGAAGSYKWIDGPSADRCLTTDRIVAWNPS